MKIRKIKKEISAGAVIFKKERGVLKFLLLLHEGRSHGWPYWAFPKGHIEKNETEIVATKREIYEETGLKKLKFIEGFRRVETYFFARKISKRKKERIFKIVIWRLAEVLSASKVKISWEHEGFEWYSEKETAKKLNFAGQKTLFRNAVKFFNSVGFDRLSQKVFETAKKIPKGRVSTYKEIARVIGAPKGVRWVGYVLNKNSDPEIPCHRVVMADGRIGGYNKGTAKKAMLLEKEGVIIENGKIDIKRCKFKI